MFLLLLACGAPTVPLDADGDGWAAAEDCDDDDPTVHPDAVESCDGADEDCDGHVDEDAPEATTWHFDFDEDGYGGSTVVQCSAPTSGVLAPEGGDCDDINALVHPGADERCDGVDQDCDGAIDEAPVDGSEYLLDADADGWGGPSAVVACEPPEGVGPEGDCDDTDPTVSPQGTEVCNGVDDDCDGEVDTDATTGPEWTADLDGDGYGDGVDPELSCEPVAGHAEEGGDCDDADPSTNPGADEHCGGGDENCDGEVDEASAADAPAWYTDADGDRFGASLVSVACEGPAGTSVWDGDCDDGDASVNPGVVEACDATFDSNCDGSFGYTDADGDGVAACVDCDDADAGWSAPLTWYADADADGFGDSARPESGCWPSPGYGADATDCDDADADAWPGADEVWYDGVDQACDAGSDYDADGDGHDAETYGGGDCLDIDPAVHPGAVEVCNDWLDNDCDGAAPGCRPEGTVSVADGWAKLTGEDDYDMLGDSVAPIGDLDGDGRQEIVIGASAGTAEAGTAYLVQEVQAGGGLVTTFAAATIEGEVASNDFGVAVASLGDVDGDGETDFAVGATDEGTAGYQAGAVYLFGASVRGTVSAATADAKILGEEPMHRFGLALSKVGDLDGDGYDDLLAGSYYSEGHTGRVHLLMGPMSGTISVASAAGALLGDEESDFFGSDARGGMDLDGDGAPDFLVGAQGKDGTAADAGAVYVYTHLPLGTSLAQSAADAMLVGERESGFFGFSVSAAGDVDGDGHLDVLVGAPWSNDNAYASGLVEVYLGPIVGEVLESSAILTVYSSTAYEAFGTSVDLEDVDQDGLSDVVATGYDGSYATGSRGAIVYSPATGTLPIADADLVLEPESSTIPYPMVRSIGDFDGDAYPDLVFTNPGLDDAGLSRGAAYFWLGGGF